MGNGVWKELCQVGGSVAHAAHGGTLSWPGTISSCSVLHMNTVGLQVPGYQAGTVARLTEH